VHDPYAEKAVLGHLVYTPSFAVELSEALSAADFFEKRHQVLFNAVLDIASEHTPGDWLGLRDKLAEKGILEECGGSAYLAEVLPEYRTVDYIVMRDYVPIIKKFARKRRLMSMFEVFFREAREETFRVTAESCSGFVDQIISLYDEGASQSHLVSISDEARDFEIPDPSTREKGKIPTGLRDLNKSVDVFRPGAVSVIAGRPGMGKTSMMREILLNCSSHINCLVCSLEEPSRVMTDKLVCAAARVDYTRFYDGYCNQAEVAKLTMSVAGIAESKIMYYSAFDLSSRVLRFVLKRLDARELAPRAVFIDYLQLMAHPFAEQFAQAVGKTCRELKLMALERGMSVILVSQLNRQPEQRAGHKGQSGRPRLSDLRDSGAIEQDADNVIFIWSFDQKPDEIATVERKISVAKSRYGAVREFDILFIKDLGRMMDISGREEP